MGAIRHKLVYTGKCTAAYLAIVLSVMPASAASVLIVRDYGGDTDFAGQMVLSTTLASIITVPVLLVCML